MEFPTFPTIEMTEIRKIEAQIGFVSGILIGALSAGVLVLFFTDWEWYFKLFSAIGSLGIMGSLYMSLSELIKGRRNLLATAAEMKKVSAESNAILNESPLIKKIRKAKPKETIVYDEATEEKQ
jgi:hypothetical protein